MNERHEWGLGPKKKNAPIIPVIHRPKPPIIPLENLRPWYYPWETPPADQSGLTLKMVIRAVANHFQTTAEELAKHQRRDARVNRARMVAYYLCRELTDKSLLVLAREMNRNHTSVLYGVRQMEPIAQTDPDIVAIRKLILGDIWREAGKLQPDPNQLSLEV